MIFMPWPLPPLLHILLSTLRIVIVIPWPFRAKETPKDKARGKGRSDPEQK